MNLQPFCDNEKIKLAFPDVPPKLFNLFASEIEESNLFLKHICAYNSIFAFTSFRVKLDKNLTSARGGVYTFKVEGQIYHDFPSLIPNENGPAFFQLYFLDITNEHENRMKIIISSFVWDSYRQIDLDQHVYNNPSDDQAAAIWIERNNSNIHFERDIVVHSLWPKRSYKTLLRLL